REIKSCGTSAGVRLAYATAGSGPPLVKAGNWMNHLEYDWESPVWRHVLRGLAKDHTLVRYDARGNGLSDCDVGELSLDGWVSDLDTVVDAAGDARFPLLRSSQGCAGSVAYAVRPPTVVMHARGDAVAPFEAGRRLASGIPGARFVAFQGQNHLFLENEPAFQRFFEEIELFLKG